ncbi:ribulose-phosphate 3-epimerase [Candidatus Aminicenantes bacterium AC-335-A11]|jgi:ribulose-phosphate 3-epimerase|nr:ribulose-phosphate 3-epimerase [SCandidatus Aminicenantes bacterium Aminicenantia_JdfR_composite]MCP2597988.1 ribulose-phosphate 3-epimerase [Candidatus Aminicenantes bacterium AC-335-L06]MCP2618835.1 ribulose-phosphate 3-epimerase [Candidatus Aminicenantes bacterium AC-335-A11]
MVKIAPSILSADFSRIGEEIKMVEKAGADLIHIDIMDGHFVPNITFGPDFVKTIRKLTTLPLDVHLMISNPHDFIEKFANAGADWISFHIEASPHPHRLIYQIKNLGKKAGITLNPGTPIHFLNEILKDIDFVLIMSVNPGFGGQEFIPSSLPKIAQLSHWIKGKNLSIPVEVDGGVNINNCEELVRNGADILVSGSGIFHSPDPSETIKKMKKICERIEK